MPKGRLPMSLRWGDSKKKEKREKGVFLGAAKKGPCAVPPKGGTKKKNGISSSWPNMVP